MDAHSKLWYLENFNLFDDLSRDEMMSLEKNTTMSTAKKGQYIYFPEDPSSTIFFLKKGKVKIASTSDEGRETIKAILRPGEIFGELALTREGNRRDFAQAMEPETLICTLSLSDMEEMMSKNGRISLRITKLMGFRRIKMERKLESVIFKDARTRIVDLIREMAEETGRKVGDETLIKHSLTHQDIANLTASSRQVVTTVLNELRNSNIINFERKRILVRDLAKLK